MHNSGPCDFDPTEWARSDRQIKGKIKLFDKEGDMNQANADFNNLTPKNAQEIADIGRVGELSNGNTVTVSSISSDGRATLSI